MKPRDSISSQFATGLLIVEELPILKEDFAKAYQSRNYEQMDKSSEAIHQDVKYFIETFHYARRGRPSLFHSHAPKTFRHDQRLITIISSLRRVSDLIRRDIKAINLLSFLKHVDQSELWMYRALRRIKEIEKYGIDQHPPERAKTPDGENMKRNIEGWREWLKVEQNSRRMDNSSDAWQEADNLFKELDALMGVSIKKKPKKKFR